MQRRLLFAAIWVGLVVYAFAFAPPDQPDTVELITQLSTGQWDGINPWTIALFNAMGIWPLVYSGILFADGDGQRVRAWPFAIASMAVGAFALLPYLVLRTPHQTWSGVKGWGLKIWDLRWLGLIGLGGAIACLGFGITQGDGANFVQQWQTSRFIHVMSLDFCLLSLLFPTLVPDDMARRGIDSPVLLWLTVLPLLGPCLYLIVRSPLVPTSPAPLVTQGNSL
ncbi:MAG: DUF2834 domain-containing protein [Thermosynechococcaceae cyanobacterium MS004]|nr:DUF2834 domain-containing protein [Thermosynechococcaceae cyanobacterium MS004]